MSTVHFYQCPNCKSTLLTPFNDIAGATVCPLCHCYMRWKWDEEVAGYLKRPVSEPTPEVMDALRHPEHGVSVEEFFNRR